MKRPAAAETAGEPAVKRKTGKQPEQEAEQGLETKPDLEAGEPDAKEWLETKPDLQAEKADEKERLETKPDQKEMDDENPEEEEPMEEDHELNEEEMKPKPGGKEKERLGTKPNSNSEKQKPNVPQKTAFEMPPELHSLSATQLVKHENWLAMVERLKTGEISNADFLATLNGNQRTGLFHLMGRNRTPEQQQEWSQLTGKGSQKKKEEMLLQFLQGGLEQSQIEKSTTMKQGWKQNKDLAWVSWKKICDEFGSEEAVFRVKNGLILSRKDPAALKKGLKIWQFLKVDRSISGRRGMEKVIGVQACGGLEEGQAKALSKAIQSQEAGEESEQFFEDVFQERKPKVQVSLMDQMESENESQEGSSDVEKFLANMENHPGPSDKEAWRKAQKQLLPNPEAWNKANAKDNSKATAATKPLSKKEQKAAEAQKKKEEKRLAQEKKQKEMEEKRKAKEQKWQENVEKLSTCEENTAQKNLGKLINMINVEMKEGRLVFKRNPGHDGLKESLNHLEACRSDLEKALIDEPALDDTKALLARGATLLRNHKKTMQEA